MSLCLSHLYFRYHALHHFKECANPAHCGMWISRESIIHSILKQPAEVAFYNHNL